MAMVAASEKFLAKHIGGRYQESMTPEVAKRLAEITVDPKTVTLAKPATASTSDTASANVGGKWNLTAHAGQQPVAVVLDLKQQGSDFAGTMTSDMGGGPVESGKVSGNDVKATIRAVIQGQAMDIQMQGKLEGGNMSGIFVVPGIGDVPFTAVKDK
jgi:hypothetical protein